MNITTHLIQYFLVVELKSYTFFVEASKVDGRIVVDKVNPDKVHSKEWRKEPVSKKKFYRQEIRERVEEYLTT